MTKVTPWDVSGKLDYNKLIKDFGVKSIGKLPKQFTDNILFKRGTIFAERDFKHIIEAVENKKPFIMLTGLMPSGRFHIGHALIAKQMIFYQSLGAKIYIAVADIEAYNTRGKTLEELREIAIEEYILNYIALGLKPENVEIYFQSQRSQNANKASAYYRLQNQLSAHITFNEFKAVYGEVTPGKMVSALLQVSDILHPNLPEFEAKQIPIIVPVGIDQDPHIRITRDLAKRFKGAKFGPVCSTYNKFMPGLKGGKMSSSDPYSHIALTETPKEAKKKINKYAFSGGRETVEEHRKKGGNPDVDVSFQYLRMMFEEDDVKLAQIEKDYRSGKLLSGELKAILIEKMSTFLEGHHKKREKARSQLSKFIK